MIRTLERDELAQALAVIHAGFATAAEEFGLTKENCPTNGAFMPMERLEKDWQSGVFAAGSFECGCMTGYVQVRALEDGVAEMEKLCVLPEFRHGGMDEELVRCAQNAAKEMGAKRLLIGIIERNTRLKNWYASLGFVHMGTKEFPFLPFTVGYMIKEI